jgi:cell wall-associated NlpC family hydrolase
MNIDLKKTVADEKALAASLGPAQAALKVASAEMGTLARNVYMTGQISGVTMLLDGPGTLLDRMSALDQMSRRRQRDIKTYTDTTLNYDARQAALKNAQVKQVAQGKQLKNAKDEIEDKIAVLMQKRRQAYGQAQDKGKHYTGTIPSISGKAGVAVRYAYNAIGANYHYGADGPYNSGYDCSGLTSAAWAAAGKSLPHNAAAQYSATARIGRGDLKAGDLVFYRSLGHVGLYVGGNMIIDSPHTGTVVNKRSIDISTPYGYGRVR